MASAQAGAISYTDVISDAAWVKIVADELGLRDVSDVRRVEDVLFNAGIRPGRASAVRHRARVVGVYFAGIKHLRDQEQAGDSDAAVALEPFAYGRSLADGFNVFATEGVNEAGKSSILGVVVWALQGVAPSPTLQGDVRDTWLREAAVGIQIDNDHLLVQWGVEAGVPHGRVIAFSGDVDFASLAVQGVASATAEFEGAEVERWPAASHVDSLLSEGLATLVSDFDTRDEFASAVGAAMMPRLGLEPVRLWQRRPKAIDPDDGEIAEHGWSALSQAMAILDPTTSATLGDTPIVVQQLLSVYLGSGWAMPTAAARLHKQQTEGDLAALRRQQRADVAAAMEGLVELRDELAAAEGELGRLAPSPDHDIVEAAVRRANADAIAAARAQRELLDRAAAYGAAGRALEEAERALAAQEEARATRRFFHALRPSCCPRCDRLIDETQWSRERSGHCSLCDGELDAGPEQPTTEDQAETPVSADASSDGEDEEDEIHALRQQVEALRLLEDELSREHDRSKESHQVQNETAARSAAELESLDRAAASNRSALLTRVAVLRGRLAERERVTGTGSGADFSALEFKRDVYAAAERAATERRNNEQQRALEVVSRTLTELGAEFGIRNLVGARLQANGHLPVRKGNDKPVNFGSLNMGERMRLKVALVVGLLRAGREVGTGRHPGILVLDDLTTHEVNHEDAAAMARSLAGVEGLQVITASTYQSTLVAAVGAERVIVPGGGRQVFF